MNRPIPASTARQPHWPGSPPAVTGPRDDDLVFPGITGSYPDASALSRRYKAALQRAALRPLRLHDLRHHPFGTRMIAEADIRRVQEWMGHADIAVSAPQWPAALQPAYLGWVMSPAFRQRS